MFRRFWKKKEDDVRFEESEIDNIDVSENEEEFSKTQERRWTPEYTLAMFFTVNAMVVSLIAGIVLKLSLIATRYYDRIMAINPDYTIYVDFSTYFALGLLIYALFNMIGAAYYLYEGKMGV